jgi:GH43 family beta-xylosidase
VRRVLGLAATLSLAAAAPAVGAAQPVIPGDVPDPSVIRAPDGFYAVATSKDWVPAFPLFFSPDLVHWRRAGAVLPHPPAWAKGDFWAPELARFDGRYRVYFAASRRHGRPCIGLATARRPGGPWRDRGRVLCPQQGAIDPKAVVDERGRPWLAYKRFGVGGGIWLRPLRAGGTRAGGPARRLIAPGMPWQQATTEGPDLVRHAGAWYLVYSGGHCCRPPCTYAVGVARAPTLLGPWVVRPQPSLRGDAQVKCPGHGTLVDDGAGRTWLLHHAYPVSDVADARRQAFLTPVMWGADGWPVFGPLEPATTGGSGWSDAFAGHALRDGWQWRAGRAPLVAVSAGALRLRAAGRDRSRLIARQVTLDDFAAEATVTPGRCRAGLAVVGSDDRPLGLEAGGTLRLWRGTGPGRALARAPRPAGRALRLRAEVSAGRTVRFLVARAGTWAPVGGVLQTAPGVRILRVALTCAGRRGAAARFARVAVEPLAA